jgi:hypothetical protein
MYGNNWFKVAEVIKTRTISQIRSFAQTFLKNPELK